MRHDRKHGRPKSGFSRRDFIKGSGAAAAATALATGPGLATAQAGGVQVAGPGKTTIALSVNGQQRSVTVEPRMTLLEVLRYQLKLTGAKPISAAGSSGGSTVFVDDKPVTASTTLAMQCVGKKIQTIESFSAAEPDPVAAAFVHADAQQCGFCTPGFVMAVRAFVNKNPQATEAEIREGLNGNLCRCGTYANVVQAVLEVVKGGSRG